MTRLLRKPPHIHFYVFVCMIVGELLTGSIYGVLAGAMIGTILDSM